ncbi:cytochrome P450 2K6-like [Leptonychotes weddellii]|uniref:Cytochrome P450 2K6-like n=1 Tax=Leptonychotes weddellii TaxID=9713 RepID=A0A7F8QZF0_LEPWE|nr:cytochrome P450 2K6-like [Leptonychotes weddellii]
MVMLIFLDVVRELSQKYGSIYSIQMGPKKVVVLSGYEIVKAALVNYGDQFGERSQVPIFERLFEGKGIVFSHGETSKTMRRFSLTTLRNFGMGKRLIEDRIIEECQHLVGSFESHRGKPFEVKTVMNASVANVIVSVLLGKRFADQDIQFLRLLTLTGENVKLVGGPRIAVTVCSLLNFTSSKEKDTSTAYFSDENLVALVSYLLRFAAGTETVASTLCWALLLMMRYPEVQKKVCDEITKVVGSAQPRIAHGTQMPYTDAVIHEVQRFADILPTSLPHATTTDVIFKNYYIPKGTEVTTLLTSVLRDQAQWEKSDTFNPEHFLSSTGKFIKKEAFMPFSVGRRLCAGESLAKMELFLFFTSLMQKFTFQPPPGVSHRDLDLTPDIGFNTRPMPHKLCALLRA